ncbi:414_t:CDS:2 [Ambispora leptoticha]|uniref:414_t:CDS:1 n=1 Tax=Ambispora leptoticha TaxID=144679 RepID=A0A9N8VGX0_9GLOM|nr:414_t:CDS:2 [Ambispora leptoticha]
MPKSTDYRELLNQFFLSSYKSVHRDFLADLEEDDNLRALKNQFIPNHERELTYAISVNACGMICNSKLVKRRDPRFVKEHPTKAKLERNYYNKNINCDWAQNVHVPDSGQQIGKVYYLSAHKYIYLIQTAELMTTRPVDNKISDTMENKRIVEKPRDPESYVEIRGKKDKSQELACLQKDLAAKEQEVSNYGRNGIDDSISSEAIQT